MSNEPDWIPSDKPIREELAVRFIESILRGQMLNEIAVPDCEDIEDITELSGDIATLAYALADEVIARRPLVRRADGTAQ